MKPIIAVEKLSKQYRIGCANETTTLRESLVGLTKLKFLRNRPQEDTIWALRDVSFSIEQGETVGVIGRNGAGKSTLLKVLSRITYPTLGEIKVNGRVAALLEVGTGFHQELTGRENIYLNGSILGMPKKEVDRKFEEIVEFSGVRRFLDTPIKRYSSGMRLRLGFAVAAHLDPDILIVDEVLAVGDAGFQKKCLNAITSLREGSRTVLFVSHNLAAVENLCRRCIWIDGGQIRMDGESRRVIEAYTGSMGSAGTSSSELDDVQNRRGNGKIRYRRIEFLSQDGTAQKVIAAGDPVVIRFHYFAKEPISQPSFGFRMYSDMGTLVTETSTWHHSIGIPLLETGDGYLDLEIDCLNLMSGKYLMSLWLTDMTGALVYDNLEHGISLEIEKANIYRSGRDLDNRCGLVFFPQRWDLSGMRMHGAQLSTDMPEAREALAP